VAYSSQHRKRGGSNWDVPASFRAYNRSLKAQDSNAAEAFRLNQIAADEGMHDAVLAMGWFYRNGIGVAQDNELALSWWRKSARQGDPRAMFSLGQMAFDERDYTEALAWFTRATDHGHTRSIYWIGKLHWRGHGVPRDRKLAMQFFSQAAVKKELEAQRAIRFLSYCQHISR
jgi:TPR repeat protein